MEKYQIGYEKKSFSLNYHNGEIWCEHLDAMQNQKELVIKKFKEDLVQISKPSTSSFIIITVQETYIDDELYDMILTSLKEVKKSLSKIVFVGLPKNYRSNLKKIQRELPFMVSCIDDFEKAKESFFLK